MYIYVYLYATALQPVTGFKASLVVTLSVMF